MIELPNMQSAGHEVWMCHIVVYKLLDFGAGLCNIFGNACGYGPHKNFNHFKEKGPYIFLQRRGRKLEQKFGEGGTSCSR